MNNWLVRKDGGSARSLLRLPILALGAASLVGCASTGSLTAGAGSYGGAKSNADYMQLGERTVPPTGFLDFCIRRPGECGLRVAEQATASPDEAQSQVQKAIYRKYMWDVAFQRTAPATPAVQTASIQRPASQGLKVDVAWRRLDDGASASFAMFRSQATTEAALASEATDLENGSAPSDAAEAPLADPAPTPISDVGAAMDALARADDATVQDIRSAPIQIAMDDQARAELNMVNRMVNSMIVQTPDRVNYGVDDYWTEPLEEGSIGPKRGDCEDYVLEKRKALIAAGMPEAALSIAVVNTRRGEAHAVLLVATDRGELVLDSLSPWITSWRDTPYQWIERQAPGEPMIWVRTNGKPARSSQTYAVDERVGVQPAAG